MHSKLLFVELAFSLRLLSLWETVHAATYPYRRIAKKWFSKVGKRIRAGLSLFGLIIPIVLRLFLRRNKNWIIVGAAGACAVIISANMIDESRAAYEYKYHGRVLGVVKSEDQVHDALHQMEGKMLPLDDTSSAAPESEATAFSGELPAGVSAPAAAARSDVVEIVIDEATDIEIAPIQLPAFTSPESIDTEEEVVNNIISQTDVDIKAFEITVDGVVLGVLSSKEEAESLLESIKDYFLVGQDRSLYSEIGFAEDVQVNEIRTRREMIGRAADMYNTVLAGTFNVKTYTVVSGDSFWDIAVKNEVSIDEIADWNPQFDFPMIHIGDELLLQQQTSLINVRTLEEAQYEADIPFEIIYQNTDTLYEGEEEILIEGKLGRKDVLGDIVYVNGVEVERIERSSTVLEEPSTQTTRRGTKPVPPRIGTGTYIWPISAGITSRYGTRWGRLHAGLDFGAARGTDIHATDGGNVTFVGYDGGYGLTVKIDHGGGMSSMYAHCSSILVSVGDLVFQGQHVAESGNTGSSTGPHLHFGIYKFGVSQNPLNYLS
jgi:murein DD-endopeptidase MepM/ murein hydrolase activator NlpD